MYFVLSFSFVISDMYAEPTERLHEKHPAITLERRTNGKVLAKAMIKCEAKSAQLDDSSIGFLPNLSESFPRYGETKNWIKEKIDIYRVTMNGPAPRNITWKGRTAIIIELKAITSKKTYKSNAFTRLQ